MGALAALPFLSFVPSTRAAGPGDLRSGQVLVAYFSRTGNTRVVARQIQRDRDALLFEIRPARPYPEDYYETVEQARKERDSGFMPPLDGRVTDLARFDTIFLGFPIWGMTAPPIIRSFLAAHDFKGKTLIPFITHGGYGVGSSLKVLGANAKGARLHNPGFVIEADQEKRALESVGNWLDKLPYKK